MNSLNFLDIMTILSFIIQLENNDELHAQSTNDEVENKIHSDIMDLLEDNRKLFSIVIEQNKEILNILRKEN